MKLTLPLPPSVNHYWRSVVIKGAVRVLMSKAGREYKEHCRLVATAHRTTRLDGEVRVAGTVYMARLGTDLDNRVKPLLDALTGICYDDDKQVAEIHLVRDLDRGNPRVELTVEPYATERAA